jgi:drug/metabolite transporter (DMT)-like permease
MSKIRIFGAVILAMIFWSFSFIWFKIANEYYRPITIVFFRLLFAVIVLTTYLTVTGKFVKIKKEDRKLFLLLAVFEPFIYFLGESFGLTYVSSTTGSVIISTIPVFAAIGAWLFFRERLGWINYTGILMSFAGIMVFILKLDGTLSFSYRGLLLLAIAVFAAVGYNLTLGKLAGGYNPVYIVNVQNIIGSILFFPVFVTLDLNSFINSSHSFKSVLPVIELSIFASCGAFILFAFAVRHMGVSKAVVFTNCVPILTAVFAFMLVGDKLSLQNIAGMIIVIAGLFLSQSNRQRKVGEEAVILTGKSA